VRKRTPQWIDLRDVLAMHDRLLAVHGGRPGLRDKGLLESALARPRQHQAYSSSAGIVEMAALYTASIVANHPFIDGNKRTGFVVGVLFLELNGFAFKASEEDATQAVISLSAGSLDETGYATWLRANSKLKRR
jgi:death-on-curing protein